MGNGKVYKLNPEDDVCEANLDEVPDELQLMHHLGQQHEEVGLDLSGGAAAQRLASISASTWKGSDLGLSPRFASGFCSTSPPTLP